MRKIGQVFCVVIMLLFLWGCKDSEKRTLRSENGTNGASIVNVEKSEKRPSRSEYGQADVTASAEPEQRAVRKNILQLWARKQFFTSDQEYTEIDLFVINKSDKFIASWQIRASAYDRSGRDLGWGRASGTNLAPQSGQSSTMVLSPHVRPAEVQSWVPSIEAISVAAGPDHTVVEGEERVFTLQRIYGIHPMERQLLMAQEALERRARQVQEQFQRQWQEQLDQQELYEKH